MCVVYADGRRKCYAHETQAQKLWTWNYLFSESYLALESPLHFERIYKNALFIAKQQLGSQLFLMEGGRHRLAYFLAFHVATAEKSVLCLEYCIDYSQSDILNRLRYALLSQNCIDRETVLLNPRDFGMN